MVSIDRQVTRAASLWMILLVLVAIHMFSTMANLMNVSIRVLGLCITVGSNPLVTNFFVLFLFLYQICWGVRRCYGEVR